jgi:hypothetical protein
VILNEYAVLDAFLSLLRLGLGLLVVWLGFVAWSCWRPSLQPEARKALEDRCYLLYLLAGLLLTLNVLSWPLFYLLLQSYVSEWAGVMCIYGVTRVGLGSVGSSRFLPPLLTALQATKPALVFLSGAWFVLYLVNRHTRTAPLTGRVLLVLLAAAVLAAGDAAAELTYLAIPKKEEFLSTGCCSAAFDVGGGPSRFVPRALLGGHGGIWLYAAYYAANAGMIAGLAWCVRRCRGGLPAGWLAALAVAALLCAAVSAAFLIEEAAPRLLRMPGHHCVYDFVPRAPGGVAAIALFAVATFCVGWGCTVGGLGGGDEARPFVPGMIAGLFRLAVCAYVGSAVLLTVGLA